MVYAPSKTEAPPSSMPQDGEEGHNDAHSCLTRRETVESLRHAVEVQETHVRMLRARKAAREQLLQRIQSLLATGDKVEAHVSVEHIVREAEESLEQLVRTEDATPTPGAAGNCESEASLADPMARVFHSGVEAQLAALADYSTPLSAVDEASVHDMVEDFSNNGNRGRSGKATTHRRRHAKKPTAVHTDPAGAGTSPMSHSAATTALLAKSASREKAGRAAMLAALASLQLSMHSGSGNATSASEPAWLRVSDDGNDAAEKDRQEAEQKVAADQEREPSSSSSSTLHRCLSRCPSDAAIAEDYSDDFEAQSETSESAEAPEDGVGEEEDNKSKEGRPRSN